MNFLSILKSLKKGLFLLFFLYVQANVTFGQNRWDLSFPNAKRVGHYFIESPANSNHFYLFGHGVQKIDINTKVLSELPNLPSEILLNENFTGYINPNSHMDIFALDDQKIWIAYEGDIYKSVDSGNTWTNQLSLNPNTQYSNSSFFTSIHFPSENVGYAVGTADKIFRTLDGGDNWQQLQWSTSTTPYRRLSSVHFETESVGFALGYEVDDILLNIGIFKPLYYYTTDAGITWTETTFSESNHHYLEIQTVWQSTWYLSLTNRNFLEPRDKILRSTDGGTNWNEISLPSQGIGTLVLRDMNWFTPNEGVILGSKDLFGSPNYIYKTYDGGMNWKEINLDQGIKSFFSKIPNTVMEFKGNQGIISGADGNILYTTDKGETWQTIQEGYPDVYSMASDAGVTYAATYGNLLLKHNQTGWTTLAAPQNSHYQKIAFEKIRSYSTNMVAVKDVYGELHISNNGGNNWSSLFSNLEDRVLDMRYRNGSLKSLNYNTTNNELRYYPDANVQQNFEVIATTAMPASVFDLFFINNIIYARVESFLYKRENNVWQQVFHNNHFIRSLLMDTNGNGLMKFQDNSYHFSHDTGISWQPATFSQEIQDSIDFSISTITAFNSLNDSIHYAIIHGTSEPGKRFNSHLIISSDSGASWTMQDNPPFPEPNRLGRIGHTVDQDGSIWIGTANGNILKGWNSITSIIDPEIEDLRIYPNPAYYSINIDIPFSHKDGEVNLFNTLGEMVLVQRLSNRSNSISLNGLSPGVYIAVFYIDGKRITKKIIKES